MSDAERGAVATVIAGACTLIAFVVAISSFAHALWVGESVPSTRRSDSVMIAAAIAAPLFFAAIVSAAVAVARIRAPRTIPARMKQGAPFAVILAASAGIALCVFMFLAGTVLAIGVG